MMFRSRHTHRDACLGMLVAASTLLAQPAQPPAPEAGPPDVPIPARLDAASDTVKEVIQHAIERAREAPDDPRSWRALGVAYQANSYHAEAETCYLRAMDMGMDDGPLWHLLATDLYDRGDVEGALRAVAHAIAKDPKYAPARCKRASWFISLGRVEEAHQDYLIAVDADPTSQAAMFGLARIHLLQRKPEAAIEVINGNHLTEGPNAAYAYQLLANAYRQTGRQEEAADAMIRGRDAHPVWPDPWLNELGAYTAGYVVEMNRILAKLRQNDYQAVIDLTEQFREHYPDDALLLEYRATALWNSARRQEGFEAWQQAMRVDPTNFHPHLTFARAISEGQQPGSKAFNLGLQHIAVATQLNPNDAESHEFRANLLARAGHADAAIDELQTVVKLDPTRSNAYGMLGELYLRRDRFQDAEAAFKRVVEIAPDSGAGYALLASAALSAGDIDVAREALVNAERFLPADHPLIKDVKDRLSDLLTHSSDGGGH